MLGRVPWPGSESWDPDGQMTLCGTVLEAGQPVGPLPQQALNLHVTLGPPLFPWDPLTRCMALNRFPPLSRLLIYFGKHPPPTSAPCTYKRPFVNYHDSLFPPPPPL